MNIQCDPGGPMEKNQNMECRSHRNNRSQDGRNIYGANTLISKEAAKEALRAEVRTGAHSFI